jgi:O-antigen biosynthesis protein
MSLKRLRTAVKVLRQDGPKALYHRTKRFVSKRVYGPNISVTLSVAIADVLKADWTKPLAPARSRSAEGPLRVNWILPPPTGPGSGGHLNIFRFVRHLESKGHRCHIYYYDPNHEHSQAEAEVVIKQYPAMKAEVTVGLDGAADCDALFATSWQTAYPAFNLQTDAKKFYFVQDFEPTFYATGTESVLAENTYRFGFYGITAGRWLTTKLTEDYSMPCDYYDFGSDFSRYTYKNDGARKRIFFYARPVTPRRGFELGAMALELFHRKHPEYELHFAGWDVGDYKLPFKFVNHGSMKLGELNELYNTCAAGLVISLTNMSLLPLELLSSGCIPVMNDGLNNRLVSDNPYIAYTQSSPQAMADELSRVVSRDNLPEYARKAADSVQSLDWEASGEKLEAILVRELRG